MDEMRIIALLMFLCGLVIGFVFGIMCKPNREEHEYKPITPLRSSSGYQPLRGALTKENPPPKNR